VELHGKLRQWASRGTKEWGRPAQHVECRLVAGTQQRVLPRAVEAHRAAGVGADLRIGDASLRPPGRSAVREPEILRADLDQQRLAIRPSRKALREDGAHAVERDIPGPERAVPGIDQAAATPPGGPEQVRPWLWTKREGG